MSRGRGPTPSAAPTPQVAARKVAERRASHGGLSAVTLAVGDAATWTKGQPGEADSRSGILFHFKASVCWRGMMKDASGETHFLEGVFLLKCEDDVAPSYWETKSSVFPGQDNDHELSRPLSDDESDRSVEAREKRKAERAKVVEAIADAAEKQLGPRVRRMYRDLLLDVQERAKCSKNEFL